MSKVSIIIPTRNRWDLLIERAIDSVLRQSHKKWQLIIVDDGSDEDRSDEVKKIDKRIKVYRIEKKYDYPKGNLKAEWLAGPVHALNKALEHVDGDWIARLDDDDIWYPDCLENLLEFAEAGEFDFVSALWQDVNGIVGMPYDISKLYTGRVAQRGGYLGGVQTWLYRAEYKHIKYNPMCWRKSWNANNELDWFERFLKENPRIGFLPKVLCAIIPRPGETEIGSKAYVKETEYVG